MSDIRAVTVEDALEWCAERKRAIGRGAAALLLLFLVGGGLYWWLEVRWKAPPSIFDTPVDGILGYLALDDFSQLSVEERIRFLTEFADRFRGMEASDSALAAAFLAGLSGPAKEQLRQNARDLARDILADSAAEYVDLPEAERGPFIDKWAVDWAKKAQRIATGKEPTASDDAMLAGLKREAGQQDDRTSRRSGIPALDDAGAARFLDFWQGEVENTTTPKQQGQIAHFLDDVRKRFSRAF